MYSQATKRTGKLSLSQQNKVLIEELKAYKIVMFALLAVVVISFFIVAGRAMNQAIHQFGLLF